jgi:hypothetical protein
MAVDNNKNKLITMFYSGGLYHQGIAQPEVWIGPDGNPYDWNQILDGEPFGGSMADLFTSPGGGPTEECFVAGTKVLLPDNSNKNIEEIKVGDYVKSFNVKTNQFENKLVTKLYTQTHNLKDGDITVKVTFNNGIKRKRIYCC